MSRYLPVTNSRILAGQRVTCHRAFVNFADAATPVLAISDLPAPNLPLESLQFTSNVVVTATTAMPNKTQKMLRADFSGPTCF